MENQWIFSENWKDRNGTKYVLNDFLTRFKLFFSLFFRLCKFLVCKSMNGSFQKSVSCHRTRNLFLARGEIIFWKTHKTLTFWDRMSGTFLLLRRRRNFFRCFLVWTFFFSPLLLFLNTFDKKDDSWSLTGENFKIFNSLGGKIFPLTGEIPRPVIVEQNQPICYCFLIKQ